MVSLDGVRADSLDASACGLIRYAQLEGLGLELVHHIVHFRVDCMFGFRGRTLLRDLRW